MTEVQYFNQQRMALNSHAMRNTPEHKKAVSEVHRIIEKHERKGDIHQFMQEAQASSRVTSGLFALIFKAVKSIFKGGKNG